MLIDLLKKNNYAKVIANSLYVYLIYLFHIITNLLPPFLRVLCFRPLLRKCGKKVFMDHNVYIKFPWLVEIGSSVSINRGAELYCGFLNKSTITIGSGVRIGPNARILAESHETQSGSFYHTGSPIVINDNAWIAANAIILPGVTIGPRSVVAAGAVVTKDVPPHTLVAGIPAKPVKDLPSGDV